MRWDESSRSYEHRRLLMVGPPPPPSPSPMQKEQFEQQREERTLLTAEQLPQKLLFLSPSAGTVLSVT